MREGAATTIRDGARSLGAQFAAVRQKRGLTVEKVSSETHIRVQRLREIERDDFSRFAHPSYARMYAMDYASPLAFRSLESAVCFRTPESAALKATNICRRPPAII